MEYRYLHQRNAYDDAGKEESVSLHDCKAEKILLRDETLSFYFPEGIWVGKNVGSERKSFYTSEAWVDFPLLYPDDIDIFVYIFTEDNGKTVREKYEIDELLKLVNENSYRLEFISEYITYKAFRFDCWLWFDEEPYHNECEVVVAAEKMFYRWNDMYEEAEE